VIALEAVKDLVQSVEEQIVVTADHGEMLGERHDYLPFKDYEHGYGCYNRYLIEVPWHRIERGLATSQRQIGSQLCQT